MTQKQALTTAIATLTNIDNYDVEVISTLNKVLAAISRTHSDASKEKANTIRKEKTAAARAELVAQVAPVLRAAITSDMTVKEIFNAAKDNLPDGFTPAKVQNILIREMAPELNKTEHKNSPNTYSLK